jgi:acyl carrier protein
VDMHKGLLDIFHELEFDPDIISDSTNLKDELGIDSTEFAEIAVAIERELLVVVNDEELHQVKTFGELVQYVTSAPPAE